MLTITLPESESFDRKANKFVRAKSYTIQLEHSLVSLSKWESEFERPFLSEGPRTPSETLAYIRCMVVTPDFPPEELSRLTSADYEAISAHINKKMTATWVRERTNRQPNREIITSELIYFWLTSYQIPFEAEDWHLNRLLMLIRVAGEKNTPGKKPGRPTADAAAKRRQLNADRKAQLGTHG